MLKVNAPLSSALATTTAPPGFFLMTMSIFPTSLEDARSGDTWRQRTPVAIDPIGHRQKSPPETGGLFAFYSGDVLLSHTLARAVPSGLKGLTSVFGMGTGVTPSLQSPKIVRSQNSALLNSDSC